MLNIHFHEENSFVLPKPYLAKVYVTCAHRLGQGSTGILLKHYMDADHMYTFVHTMEIKSEQEI